MDVWFVIFLFDNDFFDLSCSLIRLLSRGLHEPEHLKSEGVSLRRFTVMSHVVQVYLSVLLQLYVAKYNTVMDELTVIKKET